MQRLAAGTAALALVSLTAACGGGTSGTASSSPSATSAPSSAAAPTTSSSGSAAAGGQTLTGTVGTTDQPDAFTITLTDGSGQPVSTLKAGTYQVQVKDLSSIHNFHITGPGVEQKTTVPEKTGTTFTVNLQAGTYTFVCDPHPGNMKKEFTVT